MKKIAAMVVMLLSVGQAFSQNEIFTTSKLAINGYDPVAYFKESKPVQGKKEFTYHWRDADWNFSSKENLADFKTNPEKFAPQFGGYCAYGVAGGHKATTSPEAWTIVDDKLYLNHNLDVKALWKKDQPGFIKKANENWPEVKKEKN